MGPLPLTGQVEPPKLTSEQLRTLIYRACVKCELLKARGEVRATLIVKGIVKGIK